MKPPFFRLGITTTQVALFSKSCGMPLSEAFAIADRSAVAACNLCPASFCAYIGTAKATATSAPIKIFITIPPLSSTDLVTSETWLGQEKKQYFRLRHWSEVAKRHTRFQILQMLGSAA